MKEQDTFFVHFSLNNILAINQRIINDITYNSNLKNDYTLVLGTNASIEPVIDPSIHWYRGLRFDIGKFATIMLNGIANNYFISTNLLFYYWSEKVECDFDI